MTKPQAENLRRRAIGLLISYGFTHTPNMWREYTAEGNYGKVGVTVRMSKRYKRRGYDVALFGVFDDTKKAQGHNRDCNPYTGKCNFLNISPETVENNVSYYVT